MRSLDPCHHDATSFFSVSGFLVVNSRLRSTSFGQTVSSRANMAAVISDLSVAVPSSDQKVLSFDRIHEVLDDESSTDDLKAVLQCLLELPAMSRVGIDDGTGSAPYFWCNHHAGAEMLPEHDYFVAGEPPTPATRQIAYVSFPFTRIVTGVIITFISGGSLIVYPGSHRVLQAMLQFTGCGEVISEEVALVMQDYVPVKVKLDAGQSIIIHGHLAIREEKGVTLHSYIRGSASAVDLPRIVTMDGVMGPTSPMNAISRKFL